MENLLRTLVAFQSVTGSGEPVTLLMEHLVDYFQSRGMSIAQYEHEGFPAFVATTRPGVTDPKVLFVLHADVVPAPDNLFHMQVANGNYVGRGVYDMKFAIAACMLLVDSLKDELLQYDFGIMITTDEEFGGRNGAGVLSELYTPEVCIVPDGGEQWQPETFAKGAQWIELKANGVTAHASRPWEGDHAINKLLDAVAAIRKAYPNQTEKRQTVVTVGTITGGEAPNQLAETATAIIDARTASVEDHEQLYPYIRELAATYDVMATQLTHSRPCINSAEDPYVAAFRTILHRTIRQETEMSYSYAATDARYFSEYGIPCIIVQPPGGGHHSPNEWVSVEGCDQFLSIILEFTKLHARITE